MPDDKEFELPDDFEVESTPTAIDAVGDASKDGPAPLVVVQYRRPGLLSRLTPPLLILTIAVAVTAYHRKTPTILVSTSTSQPAPSSSSSAREDAAPHPATVPHSSKPRAGESDHAAPRATTVANTAPATPPVRADVALPVLPILPAPVDEPVAASAPAGEAQTPPIEIVTQAADSRPASPFEIDPSDGLRPVQPGETPHLGAVPPATPAVVALPIADAAPPAEARPPGDVPLALAEGAGLAPAWPPEMPEANKDAILDDIQREATAIQDQRKNMKDLKPIAQEMLAAEAVTRIQSERATFRTDLREVLKAPGPELGLRIDALVGRYGRNAPPQVMAAYYRALRTAPKRMTRQAEVEMMRLAGLPEPMILDFLANKLQRTLNTRGGPRDLNEVRVRAAQLLLSMPSNGGTNRVGSPVARVSDPSRPAAAPTP